MFTILHEAEKPNINFLMRFAAIILKRAGIRFSSTYLYNALQQSYYRTLEAGKTQGDNPDELHVVDKNDASNLVIVLLNALKKYHIKYETVEDPFSVGNDDIALAILVKNEQSDTVKDLVGLVQKINEQEFYVTCDDQRQKLITTSERDLIENFIVVKKTPFSGEPLYASRRKQNLLLKVSYLLAVLVLGGFLGTAIYKAITNQPLIKLLTPLII
jgi:hypothetical protein